MEQVATDALVLTSEKIEQAGMALINSYASIDLAAERLDVKPATLRHWISITPELQVYFEIAHEGVKGLTDKQVIERLREGDPDIVKLVYNKMYAGRAKGGYNAAELGTRGYNDPLSKQIAAETEKDRSKGNITVHFNFVEKEPVVDAVIAVDDYIDVDENEDEDESSF